jgi:hypothetical protein
MLICCTHVWSLMGVLCLSSSSLTTRTCLPHIDDLVGAKVIVLPNVSKPSSDTTLAWWDVSKDYFGDDEHLVVDRGTEFQNAKMKEEWNEAGVHLHILPTGAGAFFNPNDNSFFSQVEGAYKRSEKTNHIEALKQIVQAYKKPTDQHISNYFRHCLLTGSMPTLAAIKHLISRNWIYDDKLRGGYEDYRKQYRRWLIGSRLLSSDVRRPDEPAVLGDSELDGAHWTHYQ